MPGYFAKRIKHERLRAGLTQRELAERTGIKRPNIVRLESGRSGCSERALERIAAGLGLSMGELCSEPKESE